MRWVVVLFALLVFCSVANASLFPLLFPNHKLFFNGYSAGDSNFVNIGFSGFIFGDGSKLSGIVTDIAENKFELEFLNADLTGNEIILNHGLNLQAIAKIYNNNNEEIIPDNVTTIDVNTISANLASFIPITGIWKALVIGVDNDKAFTFVVADLVDGIVNIDHNLSQRFVQIRVLNNLNEMIIPDEIAYLSNNDLNINISSFGAIAGTWTAIIVAG